MTITTEYNRNELVWFCCDGYFMMGRIVGIDAWDVVNGFKYDIEDDTGHNHFRYQRELYRTKEEVIQNLFIPSTLEDKIPY